MPPDSESKLPRTSDSFAEYRLLILAELESLHRIVDEVRATEDKHYEDMRERLVTTKESLLRAIGELDHKVMEIKIKTGLLWGSVGAAGTAILGLVMAIVKGAFVKGP